MKSIFKWLPAICIIAGLLVLFACNKENSSGSSAGIPPGDSKVSIYLTDGPVNFYKVLIDIRQVAVLIDTSKHQGDPDDDGEWEEDRKSTVWDTLSITPGLYDLLKLRNGADTLLGSGNYPSGKIIKVRITLGSDNLIYTDSATSYPLEVFGFHPYFDINVRREDVNTVTNNEFKFWLDFNLQRSIFFWSGTFYLKPYVVVFNDETRGRIQGIALPEDASPLVEAFNATDTVFAVPGDEGNYLVRGMNPGTYSLTIFGHQGYNDTTLTNIIVNVGSTTKVPAITLHK